jgi:hypothetical protein
MRLTDYVTLNIYNNMLTVAVFSDVEKAFDTTWHSGLLYKLSEIEFSTGVTERKFEVLVEGEFSAPREIAVDVHEGSVLAPVLYVLHVNDARAAPGTHLGLFSDDTHIYATEKHELRVLCKQQRGLTAVNSWCEHWNIEINEGNSGDLFLQKTWIR